MSQTEKTSFWSVAKAAFQAEGFTQTGRLNLIFTVLGVCLILAYSFPTAVLTGIEKIVLAYKTGKDIDVGDPNGTLNVRLIIGTALLALVCLFIVWKMERLKPKSKQVATKRAKRSKKSKRN